MARQTELSHLHFFHPAVLDLPLNAHPRNDRHPHPHLYEALDALNRGHFDRHVEGGSISSEKLNHAPPVRRFDDVADERFLAKLLHFHLAAFAKGMFQWYDKGKLVLAKLRGLQLGFSRNKREGANVEAVVQDFVRNIARKHAMDTYLHAWMHLAKLR